MEWQVKQLNVLIGLRGCGKTTWAKQEVEKRNQKRPKYNPACHYFDMHTIWYGPWTSKRSEHEIQYLTAQNLRGAKESVILENPEILDAETFLHFILPYTSQKIVSFDKIVFHVWQSDVETCVYNSEGRIPKEEVEKIRTSKIDASNLAYVGTLLQCEIETVNHFTKPMPEWRHFCFLNSLKLVKEKYLYSQDWTTGGCSYDDEGNAYPVYPEEPINDFKEFDDFIDKICPSISLKQYRRFVNECCSIESFLPQDYSNDEIYHSRHICDMERFYEILCESAKHPSPASSYDIDIKNTSSDVVGIITFHGISEVDVYEQIKQFKGDEIF